MELTARPRINFKYILFCLAAVLCTWLLHEFAHWLMGEILGHRMQMTLNSASPIDGSFDNLNDETLTSMAGPMFTLLQAFFIYLLLRKSNTYGLFPFLLVCFYMRLVATALNVIMVNDEGRVSRDIGLGVWTVPILMCLILLYLVVDVVKQKRLSTKFILVTLFLLMLFSSILILSDQAWHIRLI